MKQRAGHLHRAEGGRKGRRTPCAAIGITPARRNISDRFRQNICGQSGLCSQCFDRIPCDHRPLGLGVLEILELAGNLGNAGVEYGPRHAVRLRQHGPRRFGVALRLVPEPLAGRIHLNAAFGDCGPCDQDTVRVGNIAVPLIGAQMTAARAKRLAPVDRLSSVAVMAEPDRVRDIRHVVGDHGAVAAEPVARKDQPVAADILAALVR